MNHKFDIALSFATENQALVEKVYHYLKARNLSVFYAPTSEAQPFLTGRNQSEAFYDVFAIKSRYVALFVSEDYIRKEIPMEEANIALSEHKNTGRVIPIYIDGTRLPDNMINPRERNYFQSNNPAEIARHLAEKVRMEVKMEKESVVSGHNIMNVSGNKGKKQIFVQTWNGSVE